MRLLGGDRHGATQLEYGLIVALLALVIIVVWNGLGKDVAKVFTAAEGGIAKAGTGVLAESAPARQEQTASSSSSTLGILSGLDQTVDALTAPTASDSTAPSGGSDCLSVSQPKGDGSGGGDATTSDAASGDQTAARTITVSGAC